MATTTAIRNIQMPDRKEFLSTRDYLCRKKADFQYISEGSIDRIIYGDRCFIYINIEDSGGRGHHLTKIFMEDIEKYLQKNQPPLRDANYMEQMFHLDAIEEVIGESVIMIDINDCYWRTARLLGYITEETYIKGLRKKEWKIGRNSCIGSLAKTRTIIPYVAGEIDRRNRRTEQPKLSYKSIRNHIIGHVFQIFNSMFQQMGYTFYMFLTDCVVFRWDKVKYVQNYLHAENYRTKLKTIEFTAVDRINKKISWIDFGSAEEKREPKEKYYLYSHAQVVQYHGERTDQYFHRGKHKEDDKTQPQMPTSDQPDLQNS